ncbi:hypothetical protein EDEG_03281 [Edhazardia aedis USNM 41457]|uniref:Uncharacterized protein n=1 Tax=Edhazardia aedis (strain USNM 41457) TaxID=1003232 RepID=J9DI25_EDHAE|nr:hypothetical protein EDEG_03281 [Edhazardia aedis USNM 41457]|eukprot:EJW02275.1 hypothetical protein EDEG_03281 [Edhazardia aedis USNM 41457]
MKSFEDQSDRKADSMEAENTENLQTQQKNTKGSIKKFGVLTRVFKKANLSNECEKEVTKHEIEREVIIENLIKHLEKLQTKNKKTVVQQYEHFSENLSNNNEMKGIYNHRKNKNCGVLNAEPNFDVVDNDSDDSEKFRLQYDVTYRKKNHLDEISDPISCAEEVIVNKKSDLSNFPIEKCRRNVLTNTDYKIDVLYRDYFNKYIKRNSRYMPFYRCFGDAANKTNHYCRKKLSDSNDEFEDSDNEAEFKPSESMDEEKIAVENYLFNYISYKRFKSSDNQSSRESIDFKNEEEKNSSPSCNDFSQNVLAMSFDQKRVFPLPYNLNFKDEKQVKNDKNDKKDANNKKENNGFYRNFSFKLSSNTQEKVNKFDRAKLFLRDESITEKENYDCKSPCNFFVQKREFTHNIISEAIKKGLNIITEEDYAHISKQLQTGRPINDTGINNCEISKFDAKVDDVFDGKSCSKSTKIDEIGNDSIVRYWENSESDSATKENTIENDEDTKSYNICDKINDYTSEKCKNFRYDSKIKEKNFECEFFQNSSKISEKTNKKLAEKYEFIEGEQEIENIDSYGYKKVFLQSFCDEYSNDSIENWGKLESDSGIELCDVYNDICEVSQSYCDGCSNDSIENWGKSESCAETEEDNFDDDRCSRSFVYRDKKKCKYAFTPVEMVKSNQITRKAEKVFKGLTLPIIKRTILYKIENMENKITRRKSEEEIEEAEEAETCFPFDNIKIDFFGPSEEMDKKNEQKIIEENSPKSAPSNRSAVKSNLKPRDDAVEELRIIVDKMALKMEQERNSMEDDFSNKFKKLLDTVSGYLNSNLINKIEETIKKEYKIGLQGVKKIISDEMFKMETRTSKMLCELRQQCSLQTTDDGIRNEIKNIFYSSVIPKMESSVEEMKRQIIQELKSMNLGSFAADKTISEPKISLQDQIVCLINEERIHEASFLALKSTDSVYKIFMQSFVEKKCQVNESNLNFELIDRATKYAGCKQDDDIPLVMNFIKALLVTLIVQDLSDCNLVAFYLILSNLEKFQFENDITSLIMLQRKLADNSIKQRALITDDFTQS